MRPARISATRKLGDVLADVVGVRAWAAEKAPVSSLSLVCDDAGDLATDRLITIGEPMRSEDG